MIITAGQLIALLFWVVIGSFALAGFIRFLQLISRKKD